MYLLTLSKFIGKRGKILIKNEHRNAGNCSACTVWMLCGSVHTGSLCSTHASRHTPAWAGTGHVPSFRDGDNIS